MELLVAGAFIWIVCGFIGAAIMSGRDHSGCAGFALGVLFGPLGVLIAAVLAGQPTPADEDEEYEDEDRRPCPYCAEMIMRDAKICRFCGREVAPLPAPTAVAPIELSGVFVRCPVCNAKNYEAVDRCEKCGVAFLAPNQRTGSAQK